MTIRLKLILEQTSNIHFTEPMLKYAQIITCHTVTQSRRPGGYSFQMSGSSNHTKYLTLHQNMDAVNNHTARNKSFNGCKFVPRICKVFKKKSERRPTLKRSTSFSASTVFSRLPLLCRLLFQESRVLRRRTACWVKTQISTTSPYSTDTFCCRWCEFSCSQFSYRLLLSISSVVEEIL